MTTTNITVAVPLLSMLAIASVTDLYNRRIPNGLSLGGAMVGVITQMTLFGAGGLAAAVAGWLICLACFLPFYLSGGMAAGDVKLMAAVGAFLGPVTGFAACLCVLVTGAVISAGCVLSNRVAYRGERSSYGQAEAEQGSGAPVNVAGAKIPYAGAIAIGTTAVVLQPSFLMTILRNGGLA